MTLCVVSRVADFSRFLRALWAVLGRAVGVGLVHAPLDLSTYGWKICGKIGEKIEIKCKTTVDTTETKGSAAQQHQNQQKHSSSSNSKSTSNSSIKSKCPKLHPTKKKHFRREISRYITCYMMVPTCLQSFFGEYSHFSDTSP